jgi:hypothetical protein
MIRGDGQKIVTSSVSLPDSRLTAKQIQVTLQISHHLMQQAATGLRYVLHLTLLGFFPDLVATNGKETTKI